uniref:Peroxiredoxin n=1 Tax=Candidatus Kentrum sp. UNK TaxID=2126344 RepID=A0A451AW33_9GAMM|nr:MAG: Peroxiredoxin [Candidatus Kentron sp. UNK]VFK70253.1 MAG: Peroxiredoxin [Candidatus Kentron sp. UNK]
MGTASTMRELGAIAPDFSLPDFGADGKLVSRKDFRKSAGLLVVFLCNHCPYVHRIRGALVDFAKEYQPKGLAIVGINANDIDDYPEDSPDKMAEEVANFGYTFPYLFDETQEVAKAYRAACTPDFFLFDKARKLVYRGQFDDSRPKNDLPVTGRDLRAAADALLSGEIIDPDQKAGFGCNIKWKPGNEPDYFRSIRLKPSLEGALDSEIGEGQKEFSGWGPPKASELEEIGEYVRARMTRMEKELDDQRDLIVEGFERMDKRFAQVDKRFRQVDKRFEQTDKRLEQMERRFEAVDKRFDALTGRMDRFVYLSLGIAACIILAAAIL